MADKAACPVPSACQLGLDRAPTRVSDEWLLFARRNPTKLAAWVLRSMIDELIDRRLTDKTFGTGPDNTDCSGPS